MMIYDTWRNAQVVHHNIRSILDKKNTSSTYSLRIKVRNIQVPKELVVYKYIFESISLGNRFNPIKFFEGRPNTFSQHDRSFQPNPNNTTGERNYFTAQNHYGGEKKITSTDYLLLCKCEPIMEK